MQGFPAGFPAHIVYDRPAISSPATVRAGRPRVYDRTADAISAPASVRAGRPARRDAADFEFFISFYSKTTIGQGLFEVCNIATRYASKTLPLRHIVTGCISCVPSGLWQGQVLNPQRHPPTHLKVECPPPPPPRGLLSTFTSKNEHRTLRWTIRIESHCNGSYLVRMYLLPHEDPFI